MVSHIFRLSEYIDLHIHSFAYIVHKLPSCLKDTKDVPNCLNQLDRASVWPPAMLNPRINKHEKGLEANERTLGETN